MSERVSVKTFRKAIKVYCNDRSPDHRYASFDFCYQYFQSLGPQKKHTIADAAHMEESCLQLSFYLASWGMFRGSSRLLKQSSRYFRPLVKWVSVCDDALWGIDVDSYTDDNINCLIDAASEITERLGPDNKPSATLVSKILLGIFGNTPAFDTYVKRSLGVNSFNRKNLERIAEFYQDNRNVIDAVQLKCYRFKTGNETGRAYTKAKIIDMYGFITGQEK